MTREQKLLKEAHEKYKIGVRFKSKFSDNGKIREIQPFGINNHVSFEISKEGDIWCKNGMNTTDIDNEYACSNPRIYVNGEWAEIINESNKKLPKFKKDNYIVVLDYKGSSDCAKENYCFKQKKDSYYLSPYIDLTGCDHNANGSLTFDKTDSLKNWRYATEEEMVKYDKLGKPYDITTIEQKYVECIEWAGEYCKVGEIYPIVHYDNDISKCKCKSPYYDSEIYCSNGKFKFSTEEAYNKQNNIEEKAEYYKILNDCHGYKKGDIGKLIKKEGGLILFVPNRESTSSYKPNVYFNIKSTEKSTEQDFLEQFQEDICKKCANKYFDGSVNTNQYNLCEGSKCDEANESYLEELEDQIEEKVIENWYIKWTSREIYETCQIHFNKCWGYVSGAYVDNLGTYISKDTKPSFINKTEITFEYFKKFILKEVAEKLDEIKDGDYVVRTWPSGKLTMGITTLYKDILTYVSLQSHNGGAEGSVMKGLRYGLTENSDLTKKATKEQIRQFESTGNLDPIISSTISYHENISKNIKKDDILFCLKEIKVNGHKLTTIGKLYKSDHDYSFINDNGERHFIGIEFANEHFKLFKERNIDLSKYTIGIDAANDSLNYIGGKPKDSSNTLDIIVGSRGYGKTALYQYPWMEYAQQLTLNEWPKVKEVGSGLWSQIQKPEKDISIERIEPISSNKSKMINEIVEIGNRIFKEEELSTQSIKRIEVIPPTTLKIIK